ncbi:MAG: diaminopimelate epimerase [Candidatus Omnitrophota bacterium]
MKTIQFTKMVASGNDFVLVDARKGGLRPATEDLSELAKKACDRKYGVGADGLLIIEKSKKAHFKMRIFNPDGSEPTMCGNGARCAALYCDKTAHRTPQTANLRFETKAGILQAKISRDSVKLKMTDPRDLWKNIDLNLGSNFIKVHYINTGVPHAVFFVGNVDTINVRDIGKRIRFHKQFQPQGANVNFAQLAGKGNIKVRTYERGVEDETLACGTGSVAAALVARSINIIEKSPVMISTKGGEVLRVYFDYKKNKFTDVWLEGSARVVCEGRMYV